MIQQQRDSGEWEKVSWPKTPEAEDTNFWQQEPIIKNPHYWERTHSWYNANADWSRSLSSGGNNRVMYPLHSAPDPLQNIKSENYDKDKINNIDKKCIIKRFFSYLKNLILKRQKIDNNSQWWD